MAVKSLGSERQTKKATGSLLCDLLEADLAEDHFHRPAGVKLEGDDALVGELEIVVHRRLAVELDGDVAADALDGIVVPVAFLDDFLDQVGRCGLHHAAAAANAFLRVVVLAVEAAPVDLAHVALRAADGEGLLIDDLAADLHAAVGALGHLHLEDELEVLVLLLRAEEGVELEALGGGADDVALRHRPVLVDQALPAIEILAVEKVAGFLAAERGRDADRQDEGQERDAADPKHESLRTWLEHGVGYERLRRIAAFHQRLLEPLPDQ